MSVDDLAIVAALICLLGAAPSKELIKELAEFTLALVLFSDAHPLKGDTPGR